MLVSNIVRHCFVALVAAAIAATATICIEAHSNFEIANSTNIVVKFHSTTNQWGVALIQALALWAKRIKGDSVRYTHEALKSNWPSEYGLISRIVRPVRQDGQFWEWWSAQLKAGGGPNRQVVCLQGLHRLVLPAPHVINNSWGMYRGAQNWMEQGLEYGAPPTSFSSFATHKDGIPPHSWRHVAACVGHKLATYDQVYAHFLHQQRGYCDVGAANYTKYCGYIPNTEFPNNAVDFGCINVLKAVTAPTSCPRSTRPSPPAKCSTWTDEYQYKPGSKSA
ncbi:hypothetical protein H257_07895 [Aphanomyces astaci]|uniref:Uncharacterized protein n=1 Tax=Aphanomyces astaci TaxID=112090 RepID=W4GGY2_APHAT|nr:hypothetical protein H257_07895 [Aphanomyces astaci]ETV78309.1 hypothetical protein H257_07895 [Aphanomyces astaci]|eukprot:XP_009831890.1 hypothetical protein H257_07895 [Aphanomyces astaci]